MDLPVALGGRPLTSRIIPMVKPFLPDYLQINRQVEEILRSGMITNSKFVAEFEERTAIYLNLRRAVAVSSCTSGLILVLKALGLKGEVIVPSFTFFASVHSILWAGLVPVFVDCDPQTFNLDPTKVESLISPDTVAIMAVNVFGSPVDYEALEEIAQRDKLYLLVDNAHGFGSRYKGRLTGGFAKAEVFSLSPTKVFTAGEGGLVTTNDEELARKIKVGRNYGDPGTYDCEFMGLNARMEEFNAILGLKTLDMLEESLKRRERLVNLYKGLLSKLPGINFQKVLEGSKSTYKDFTILIDAKRFGLSAEVLSKALDLERIQTKRYFYPPVHRQRLYAKYFDTDQDGLAVTEQISKNVLTLPLFYALSEEEVEAIYLVISRIHNYAEEVKRTYAQRD